MNEWIWLALAGAILSGCARSESQESDRLPEDAESVQQALAGNRHSEPTGASESALMLAWQATGVVEERGPSTPLSLLVRNTTASPIDTHVRSSSLAWERRGRSI